MTDDKKTQKNQATPPPRRRVWLALLLGISILVLGAGLFPSYWANLRSVLPWGERPSAQIINDSTAPLASFYTPEVFAWRSHITQWATEYEVNPNVIALVIQIESCGNPVAISNAGAMGLMQVMPFHFENGENMIDPDTNVRRGMSVFYECLTVFAGWDLGLSLACYNGGPSVTQSDSVYWAEETQYYYRWATGLWSEVVNHEQTSQTLDEWHLAGGARLCEQAARDLASLMTESG